MQAIDTAIDGARPDGKSQKRDWSIPVKPGGAESKSEVNVPRQPTTAAIRRVGAALKRYPLAYGTAALGLKAAGLIRRPRQLDRYFNEIPPEKRCLSIGSSLVLIDGWLCTDLVPVRRATVYLDATRRWPIPSASFRYITCEHMIEHVPYEAGLQVISEAHRV